jgi:hypothetical protein
MWASKKVVVAGNLGMGLTEKIFFSKNILFILFHYLYTFMTEGDAGILGWDGTQFF